MTRNEDSAIAHRPQTFNNARYQRVVIALRQIGAPDRTGKQNITNKRSARLG
jgi:hypothetical protein